MILKKKKKKKEVALYSVSTNGNMRVPKLKKNYEFYILHYYNKGPQRWFSTMKGWTEDSMVKSICSLVPCSHMAAHNCL